MTPITLNCCLCAKPIPQDQDAHLLDEEWARRHPDLRGRLACYRCAFGSDRYWTCDENDPEHIATSVPGRRDIDAWSHVIAYGTQQHMAIYGSPGSAVLQGGAGYLQRVLSHPERSRGVSADARARIEAALAAAGTP